MDDFPLLEIWARDQTSQAGKQAGNQLFARHFPTLNRYFVNKIHEADIADLVQETMLGCLRSVAGYRGEANFRTWLLGIARYTLLHHYRTKARKGAQVDPLRDSVAELIDPAGMSTLLAKRREQTLVLTALRSIKMNFQEVLELYYWEGLTASECGKVLDISLANVRGRLRKAKEAFKAALAVAPAVPAERESVTGALAKWIIGIHENIAAGSPEEQRLLGDWNADDTNATPDDSA